MKKIILLFAALAATVTCAFAGSESAASLSKTHYNYRDFSMLSISSAFHVELTFADTYSVDVEVPDFLEPYLKVTCLAGKLRIGLANVPRDIQRKLNNQHDQLHAWVSMPSLSALSMSGATRLSTTGVPALARNQSLSIEMSGASVLENLEAASNDRMTIDLSGASTCLTSNCRAPASSSSQAMPKRWPSTAPAHPTASSRATTRACAPRFPDPPGWMSPVMSARL